MRSLSFTIKNRPSISPVLSPCRTSNTFYIARLSSWRREHYPKRRGLLLRQTRPSSTRRNASRSSSQKSPIAPSYLNCTVRHPLYSLRLLFSAISLTTNTPRLQQSDSFRASLLNKSAANYFCLSDSQVYTRSDVVKMSPNIRQVIRRPACST